MDLDLSQKYLLAMNGDYQQFVPKEVLQCVMSKTYDVTHIKVFADADNTILITSKGMYGGGTNIFGETVKFGLLNIKDVDPFKIKKILFEKNFSLILYNDGKLYMCGSIELKTTHIRYLMNNIEDIADNNGNYICITKNRQLYDGFDIDTDTNNIKEAFYFNGPIVLLSNDGKLSIYDENRNILDDLIKEGTSDLQIEQVAVGYEHFLLVTSDKQCYGYGGSSVSQTPNNIHSDSKRGDLAIINNNARKFNINNVKTVACCYYSSFILNEQGELYVCGANDFGQLGIGSENNDEDGPKKSFIRCVFKGAYKKELTKMILPPIDAIYCGPHYAIAITIDRNVYVWGKISHIIPNLNGECQYTPLKLDL